MVSKSMVMSHEDFLITADPDLVAELTDIAMRPRNNKPKRTPGGYNALAADVKAKVAAYAVAMGSTAAARHWSQRLEITISESTIRGWKAKYMKQLNEDGIVEELKDEKKGRPKRQSNDMSKKRSPVKIVKGMKRIPPVKPNRNRISGSQEMLPEVSQDNSKGILPTITDSPSENLGLTAPLNTSDPDLQAEIDDITMRPKNMKRKRDVGGNNLFSADVKAKIAATAVKIGNTDSARLWTTRLGKTVSESSVRGWKTKYMKQISEEGSVQTIEKQKQGRPTKMPKDCQEMIMNHISALSEKGIYTSGEKAISMGYAIIKRLQPNLVSHVKLGKGWTQSLFRQMKQKDGFGIKVSLKVKKDTPSNVNSEALEKVDGHVVIKNEFENSNDTCQDFIKEEHDISLTESNAGQDCIKTEPYNSCLLSDNCILSTAISHDPVYKTSSPIEDCPNCHSKLVPQQFTVNIATVVMKAMCYCGLAIEIDLKQAFTFT